MNIFISIFFFFGFGFLKFDSKHFYISLPERTIMPATKDRKCKDRSYLSRSLGYSNPQGTKTCTIYIQVLYAPLLAHKIIPSTQEYGKKPKATEDTLKLTNKKTFKHNQNLHCK